MSTKTPWFRYGFRELKKWLRENGNEPNIGEVRQALDRNLRIIERNNKIMEKEMASHLNEEEPMLTITFNEAKILNEYIDFEVIPKSRSILDLIEKIEDFITSERNKEEDRWR